MYLHRGKAGLFAAGWKAKPNIPGDYIILLSILLYDSIQQGTEELQSYFSYCYCTMLSSYFILKMPGGGGKTA